MCGRFVIHYTYDELLAYLDDVFSPYEIRHQLEVPNYNIAPSNNIISVITSAETYRIGTIKWGFKPFEKFKYPIINVRSETINDKPIYRHAFQHRRCLILANGFYEWQTQGHAKQPYYIHPKIDTMLIFAGIYTDYEDRDGNSHFSVAIVTKNANKQMQSLHDRMPVIFTKEAAETWLRKDTSIEALRSLIESDEVTLEHHPVSQRVNNVHNNTQENIQPINK
ncbi:MAG: SOS response-associated peptidase [Candidatus Izemoplasma sp.]|nr:SOS response-associated peptidase [Candidatus Izemoplasma sp.]